MSTVAAPRPGARRKLGNARASGRPHRHEEDDRGAVEAAHANAGDHAVVVDRDAARDDGRGAQPRRRGHGAVGVVGRVAHRLRVALVLLPAPAPVERRRRRRVRGRDPLRLPQAPTIRPPAADPQRGACWCWCSSRASACTSPGRGGGSARGCSASSRPSWRSSRCCSTPPISPAAGRARSPTGDASSSPSSSCSACSASS